MQSSFFTNKQTYTNKKFLFVFVYNIILVIPMTRPDYSKIAKYNLIVDKIRKAGPNGIPLGLLAAKHGYTRHYFKYHVLRAIMEIYSDIKIVKINGVEYVVSEKPSGVENEEYDQSNR